MSAKPAVGQQMLDAPTRAPDTRTAGLPRSLYAAARLYTGERLQDLLVTTIDLGLVVDHSHWNVRGPGAHPLRRLFDDLSEALAGQRALLARRVAELGVAPDGRSGTVAAESRLPELRDGPLEVADAAAAIVDRLDRVADLARKQLSAPFATDPETRYVVTRFTRLIERHRGMLQRAGA